MFYYRMSFVSLDVDVADSLGHCCCNVFDDLVNGDDDSSYLEELFNGFSLHKSLFRFPRLHRSLKMLLGKSL